MRPSAATLLGLALAVTALGAPSPPCLSIAELHKRQAPGAGSLYAYALANGHDGGGFIPMRVKLPADGGSGSGNTNVNDIAGNLTAHRALPSAPPSSSADTPGKSKPPIAGTNVHAPGVGLPPLLTLTTTPPDYHRLMVNPHMRPHLPVPSTDTDAHDGCKYEYVKMLGLDGSTPLAQLWAGTENYNLVLADVQQGGIGDCGMGAAILALLTAGCHQNIRQSVYDPHDLPEDDQVGSSILFKFQNGNTTDLVFVDDALPKRTEGARDKCWPYLGYQPAYDGGAGTSPTIFMPLFEKAFAKWLDYRRSESGSWPRSPGVGYSGLEGVGPDQVMAAVLGHTPKGVGRQTPGYDQGLMNALSLCLTTPTPCVIGTASIENLSVLGSKDEAGTIVQPELGPAVVYVADQQPQNTVAYTVVDFDQVHDGSVTIVQLVGNHAYAIDASRSTDPVKGVAAGRVTLINPWGINPDLWDDSRGAGIPDSKAEIVISLRALQLVIDSVFWVDGMPDT
ncbi:uncharacterized protein LOC62_02G002036 [Vanrija pseudolonga]|uniref:Calpain catalytic domain-containing protein n=1 Tax=Vanrija pseudolonga TaxID=143232 RepID=A0AAF0Y5L4_9TREE|nr:hypothetical protein LOC62_02G002036 [Vanrija pseudolonga]